jgi:hypothetical protein
MTSATNNLQLFLIVLKEHENRKIEITQLRTDLQTRFGTVEENIKVLERDLTTVWGLCLCARRSGVCAWGSSVCWGNRYQLTESFHISRGNTGTVFSTRKSSQLPLNH